MAPTRSSKTTKKSPSGKKSKSLTNHKGGKSPRRSEWPTSKGHSRTKNVTSASSSYSYSYYSVSDTSLNRKKHNFPRFKTKDSRYHVYRIGKQLRPEEAMRLIEQDEEYREENGKGRHNEEILQLKLNVNEIRKDLERERELAAREKALLVDARQREKDLAEREKAQAEREQAQQTEILKQFLASFATDQRNDQKRMIREVFAEFASLSPNWMNRETPSVGQRPPSNAHNFIRPSSNVRTPIMKKARTSSSSPDMIRNPDSGFGSASRSEERPKMAKIFQNTSSSSSDPMVIPAYRPMITGRQGGRGSVGSFVKFPVDKKLEPKRPSSRTSSSNQMNRDVIRKTLMHTKKPSGSEGGSDSSNTKRKKMVHSQILPDVDVSSPSSSWSSSASTTPTYSSSTSSRSKSRSSTKRSSSSRPPPPPPPPPKIVPAHRALMTGTSPPIDIDAKKRSKWMKEQSAFKKRVDKYALQAREYDKKGQSKKKEEAAKKMWEQKRKKVKAQKLILADDKQEKKKIKSDFSGRQFTLDREMGPIVVHPLSASTSRQATMNPMIVEQPQKNGDKKKKKSPPCGGGKKQAAKETEETSVKKDESAPQKRRKRKAVPAAK